MKLLVTPTAPDPPFTDRPKPGPAQQFDANQIQALIQGYPAGATTHELSDLLGIDRRTVNAILHRQDEHQNLAPTLLRGVVVGGLRCLPPVSRSSPNGTCLAPWSSRRPYSVTAMSHSCGFRAAKTRCPVGSDWRRWQC